ncbi:MAG: hypothetical protein AAFU60_12185, partial [Bacteroidota bacterium]
ALIEPFKIIPPYFLSVITLLEFDELSNHSNYTGTPPIPHLLAQVWSIKNILARNLCLENQNNLRAGDRHLPI